MDWLKDVAAIIAAILGGSGVVAVIVRHVLRERAKSNDARRARQQARITAVDNMVMHVEVMDTTIKREFRPGYEPPRAPEILSYVFPKDWAVMRDSAELVAISDAHATCERRYRGESPYRPWLLDFDAWSRERDAFHVLIQHWKDANPIS